MRARLPLLVVSVALSLAACSPADGTPLAGTTSSTPATTPTSNAAMVEPCDRTSFDLSGETQAIASIRSRYPDVTDDLSAFAISLLPPGIIDMAAVIPNNEWTLPRRRLVEMASLIRGELNLQPKADVAPADFAQSIMFALTYEVMQRSAVLWKTISACGW